MSQPDLFGSTDPGTGPEPCAHGRLPGERCPWCEPASPARARTTDPATSHQAAASVGDLRPKQRAVLQVLAAAGACTDEQLAAAYAATPGAPHQSPSGLRTRRAELVELGLVVNTGQRARMRTGRQAIVWGLP